MIFIGKISCRKMDIIKGAGSKEGTSSRLLAYFSILLSFSDNGKVSIPLFL